MWRILRKTRKRREKMVHYFNENTQNHEQNRGQKTAEKQAESEAKKEDKKTKKPSNFLLGQCKFVTNYRTISSSQTGKGELACALPWREIEGEANFQRGFS